MVQTIQATRLDSVAFGQASWIGTPSPHGLALPDRYVWFELFDGFEIVFQSLFSSLNISFCIRRLRRHCDTAFKWVMVRTEANAGLGGKVLFVFCPPVRRFAAEDTQSGIERTECPSNGFQEKKPAVPILTRLGFTALSKSQLAVLRLALRSLRAS